MQWPSEKPIFLHANAKIKNLGGEMGFSADNIDAALTFYDSNDLWTEPVVDLKLRVEVSACGASRTTTLVLNLCWNPC